MGAGLDAQAPGTAKKLKKELAYIPNGYIIVFKVRGQPEPTHKEKENEHNRRSSGAAV